MAMLRGRTTLLRLVAHLKWMSRRSCLSRLLVAAVWFPDAAHVDTARWLCKAIQYPGETHFLLNVLQAKI